MHMKTMQVSTLSCEILTLAGVRYAVVREETLLNLCQAAGLGLEAVGSAQPTAEELMAADLTGPSLGQRLVSRREHLGLSQAALARRAGIRVETLNRIERGKTEPDYSTVRKLVAALRTAAESAPTERKNA